MTEKGRIMVGTMIWSWGQFTEIESPEGGDLKFTWCIQLNKNINKKYTFRRYLYTLDKKYFANKFDFILMKNLKSSKFIKKVNIIYSCIVKNSCLFLLFFCNSYLAFSSSLSMQSNILLHEHSLRGWIFLKKANF